MTWRAVIDNNTTPVGRENALIGSEDTLINKQVKWSDSQGYPVTKEVYALQHIDLSEHTDNEILIFSTLKKTGLSGLMQALRAWS